MSITLNINTSCRNKNCKHEKEVKHYDGVCKIFPIFTTCQLNLQILYPVHVN